MNPTKIVKLNTLDEIAKVLIHIKQVGHVAIDTEYIPLQEKKTELLSLSLCCDGETTYFIDYNLHGHTAGLYSILHVFLDNPNIEKYFHNAKADLQCLWSNGFPQVANVKFDTMVALFVSNPNKKRYGLKLAVKEFFNYEMHDLATWFKKGKTFRDFYYEHKEEAIKYACEDAYYTYYLWAELKPLIDTKYAELFYEIEMPMVPLLARMEMHGILLDKTQLGALKDEYQPQADDLFDKLQKIAHVVMEK